MGTLIKQKCFDCGKELEIEDNIFLRKEFFGGVEIELLCPDCEIERKNKSKIDKEKKRKELRLELFNEFVGARYKDADLSKVDRKTFQNIDLWEKQFDGFKKCYKKNRGLVVFGNVGIGKTFFLFALLKKLFVERNINTIILRMNTLVRIHHALTFGNFPAGFEGVHKLNGMTEDLGLINVSDFVDILSNIPVLIIDEMSRLKSSEFNLNFLIEVIDNRYSNCMVTVFSGNINSGEDLYKSLNNIFGDAAIVDRIMDKTWNDVYMISGQNKRR